MYNVSCSLFYLYLYGKFLSYNFLEKMPKAFIIFFHLTVSKTTHLLSLLGRWTMCLFPSFVSWVVGYSWTLPNVGPGTSIPSPSGRWDQLFPQRTLLSSGRHLCLENIIRMLESQAFPLVLIITVYFKILKIISTY